MSNRFARMSMRPARTESSNWFVFPLLAALLCLVACIYAMVVIPTGADRVLFALILVTPAIFFLRTSPSHLVDLFIAVVVVNREIRRLLDWGSDAYDKTPLLSITPFVIAVVMLCYVLPRWRGLPQSARRGGMMIAFALLISLVLGLGNGAAVIYSLGEYATPLIVLFFAISCRPSEATATRWMTVLLAFGALTAAYGIVQWVVVPQWDAEWDIWSTMSSSMGAPVPYGMSICSTLESRGPAAMFFATVAAIAIGVPKFRKRAGIPIGVLCIFALLLTQARTGVIYLALTLLCCAVFRFKRGGWQLIALLIAISFVMTAALALTPQGQRLSDRVATLGATQNDGSARVREGIAQQGVSLVASHPFGFGLGSGGNSTLLGTSSETAIGDNGYLELLSTLGIRPALSLFKSDGVLDSFALLGTAMVCALVPALMVANMLTGCHAAYCWLLLAPRLARCHNGVSEKRMRRPLIVSRPPAVLVSP
jgi:putative inorganic carbon (hco3(-)) transporter